MLRPTSPQQMNDLAHRFPGHVPPLRAARSSPCWRAARLLAADSTGPLELFNTLGTPRSCIPARARIASSALPALRRLALDGLRQPLAPRGRTEAMALSLAKVALTFGVWGAVALWGLYVTQQPDVFSGLRIRSRIATRSTRAISRAGACSMPCWRSRRARSWRKSCFAASSSASGSVNGDGSPAMLLTSRAFAAFTPTT